MPEVTGNFELGVEPEVEVVTFAGALGGEASVQIALTNNAEHQLAYKVKVSDNNLIKIENAAGLLPSGQSANVVLKSGPLADPPGKQNVCIYNVPADGAPDVPTAFSAAPEGSGNVLLDAVFE